MGKKPKSIDEVAACPNRPRVVSVVGVGRSGTSLLTRGLAALGVDLGPGLRPGGGKNPTGFFEDEALADVCRRVRKVVGLRSASVALVDPQRWNDPAVRELRSEAKSIIRQRFGSAPLWGFKHGRTLQILPFWRHVFDELQLDDAYVVAVRHPMSVARSRGVLNARRGVQSQSDLEWLVNVVPHMRRVWERPCVVVDYDRLLAEPSNELSRVSDQLALPRTAETRDAIRRYGREFVDPDLRHSHFDPGRIDGDARLNPLVREAYACLALLARDEAKPHDADLLDRWEQVERSLAAMAPAIERIGSLESQLRRARRHPLGPLQGVPHWARKRFRRRA